MEQLNERQNVGAGADERRLASDGSDGGKRVFVVDVPEEELERPSGNEIKVEGKADKESEAVTNPERLEEVAASDDAEVEKADYGASHQQHMQSPEDTAEGFDERDFEPVDMADQDFAEMETASRGESEMRSQAVVSPTASSFTNRPRFSIPSSAFKARPAPSRAPSSQPRLTKAAALRLGISPASETLSRRRETLGTAERAAIDRQRRQSSATGSIAGERLVAPGTPRNGPRQTRASILRAGQDPSTSRTPRSEKKEVEVHRGAEDGRRTPGNKPRPSAPVASVSKPKVEPRMSKAAMLRMGIKVPIQGPRRHSVAHSVPTGELPRT